MSSAIEKALSLTAGEAGLAAQLDGDFSNGPASQPPEAGLPFGGLLAALCARAMRQGLGLTGPLRSLSVQYLSMAAYDMPLVFRPRLLRGGRSVAYATVEAWQGERITHHGQATFGADVAGERLAPSSAPPPPLDSLDPARTLGGPMLPRFARHVEYRFETGPHILGGNVGRAPVERMWMRLGDNRPLDADGLCYLLDAIYPPSWTAFREPPVMTSVDLRYDLLGEPTPEIAPDGWAFFEFRLLDHGGGWAVDEAACWGADGQPLAVARQRRKVLPARS